MQDGTTWLLSSHAGDIVYDREAHYGSMVGGTALSTSDTQRCLRL